MHVVGSGLVLLLAALAVHADFVHILVQDVDMQAKYVPSVSTTECLQRCRTSTNGRHGFWTKDTSKHEPPRKVLPIITHCLMMSE